MRVTSSPACATRGVCTAGPVWSNEEPSGAHESSSYVPRWPQSCRTTQVYIDGHHCRTRPLSTLGFGIVAGQEGVGTKSHTPCKQGVEGSSPFASSQSGTELVGRGHGSKVPIFGYSPDPPTNVSAECAGAQVSARLFDQATVCSSKRRPRALVTFRMVDHVGLPSAESAL